MKKILSIALLLVSINTLVSAGEIEWKSPQEVEKLMKEEPRKVLVDFYTSWCGWCKVMDKKTYSNDSLINYVNENFYAIKFDAESKEAFTFQGKEYKYNPKYRAHEWAVEYMGGRMSYPTTVFVLEEFKEPMSVPGYVQLDRMEIILNFINSDSFKKETFEDYQKGYVSQWK